MCRCDVSVYLPCWHGSVPADISIAYAQDTPEVTGHRYRVYFDFQGCSDVICRVSGEDHDCEYTI